MKNILSSFIYIIRDSKTVLISNMHKLSQKLLDGREVLNFSVMYWKDIVTYVDDTKKVDLNRLPGAKLSRYGYEPVAL
jgi:hypothetical protein